MDLGAHQRGPEPLLAAPPRDTVPSRFVGLPRRPYRVPCAGSQVPGWLSAAPVRVVSTPTPEALLWPRSCWLSSHPRGGHDGWGGPGPCDRVQRPRAPPLPRDSRGRVQSAQTGTLAVVAEVAEEVVGRPRSTTFTSGSLLPPVGVGHPPAWCLCQGDPARAVSPARNPHSPAGWGP